MSFTVCIRLGDELIGLAAATAVPLLPLGVPSAPTRAMMIELNA